LPFPDASFDHVYSWGVIHHSPKPERIVSEIYRVLRKGGTIGWGIRKHSPKLAEAVKDFQAGFVKKQSLYAQRLKSSFARVGQLNDPDAARDRKRFEDTIALFRKYGERYGFDPLMLAAMGYQESQLDQNARSHVGAIGIMQLMPATGNSLKVGDIRVAENNVHAGAKYMDELMDKYLTDAHFDEVNRSLFAFACYNAGPGNDSRIVRNLAPGTYTLEATTTFPVVTGSFTIKVSR
jgi:membrane-bound lytic murein transglycosylase MltF